MSDWQDPTRGPLDPRPREPVPHSASNQTPPPPPPGATYFYPAPPEKRGGAMRIGGMISAALLIFGLGIYVGFFGIIQSSSSPVATYREGVGKQRIAIIPVDGMITADTAGFVRSAIRSAEKDESIKAVVLRVDSPGGTVTASDQIHHMLKLFKDDRGIPIVASYGGYAASGGYYVSCASDFIYAEPTTITGSIGVIAPYFTIHNMLDKIGVTPEVLTSTAAKDKDTGSILRPWTDTDRIKMKVPLDSAQEQFVSVVAAGRSQHMSEQEVREMATGAGITAQTALDKKLVDGIGYIDDAIEKARTLGGIAATDPPVIIYRTPQSLSDILLATTNTGSGNAGGPGGGFDIRLNPDAVRRAMAELSIPRPSFLLQP